jgi:hypothetical protein
MDPRNPYAAPGDPSLLDRRDDEVDLYIRTIPSPLVRATMVSLAAGGLILVLMAAQIVFVAYPTLFSWLFAGSLALVGLGDFGIAWGIRRGSLVAATFGFVLAPIVMMLSLLMMFSMIGLFPLLAIALAVANAALIGVGWSTIRAMGEARDLIRRSKSGAAF